MKNLIAAIIVTVSATTAIASGATKVEEVKKPAAAASVPATPKEMPKVAKPKTKAEKEAEKKAAKEKSKSETK